MYIGSKRFSRKGRVRYGSSIFVDDTDEDLVDTLAGNKKQLSIMYVFVILSVIKIISGNAIGLIIAFFVFYFLYFMSLQKIKISFTKYRLLKISEFNNPGVLRGFGIVMLTYSLFISAKILFPRGELFTKIQKLNMENMSSVFQWIGFRNFIFYSYSQFIRRNSLIIAQVDASITLIIYFWFGVRLLNINYEFHDIHYSHISEQLISLNKEHNFSSLSGYLVIILISSILTSKINFLIVILIIFFYYILPRKKLANYSLFGSSGRKLIDNIQINPDQFRLCTITTASIFGWIPQGNYHSRAFPNNVIPREVASHYETGLRASLIPALHQANLLGAIVSSIINFVVIVVLFDFALTNNIESLGIVFLIAVGLLFFSISIWSILNVISRYRFQFQREEALIIGRSFIGRFIEPSLWIIRGNRLEGTRVQRGVSRRLIRFDKNQGIVIAYQRITIYILLVIFLALITIWVSLGALDLINSAYIIPFLYNRALEFLSDKANAELGFFIIVGYIFWIFLLLYYPRFYRRSRPQLFLDMQYPAIVPIILKDFNDHQDASLQFTKCLIETSRPKRRKSSGRPGMFKIEVILKELEIPEDIKTNTKLLFEFGDEKHITEYFLLNFIHHTELINENIIQQLRVSAETGYPKILMKIYQISEEENPLLVYDKILELNTKDDNTNIIITESGMKILLEFKISRGSS